jgi:hypothetical protein
MSERTARANPKLRIASRLQIDPSFAACPNCAKGGSALTQICRHRARFDVVIQSPVESFRHFAGENQRVKITGDTNVAATTNRFVSCTHEHVRNEPITGIPAANVRNRSSEYLRTRNVRGR